jgi:hypothetical protein
MTFFLPSLAPEIMARAFRTANGEFGVLPADAMAFLDACEVKGIRVLGWELWLADHKFYAGAERPIRAAGSWCGLIPLRGEARPAVIAGSGDLATTRRQIAALDLDGMIEPPWRAAIRINITLDD